ncbi:MAG: hypothetical protein HC845_00255 [Akkermansiaceae bacterium]|nr:hypothetical protein [Akkermansiaceae bacterium]
MPVVDEVKQIGRRVWHHIEPVYLPPYSPNFNPIERIWQHLKGHSMACGLSSAFLALTSSSVLTERPNSYRLIQCNANRVTVISDRLVSLDHFSLSDKMYRHGKKPPCESLALLRSSQIL